jgi:hypothetical protein
METKQYQIGQTGKGQILSALKWSWASLPIHVIRVMGLGFRHENGFVDQSQQL